MGNGNADKGRELPGNLAGFFLQMPASEHGLLRDKNAEQQAPPLGRQLADHPSAAWLALSQSESTQKTPPTSHSAETSSRHLSSS